MAATIGALRVVLGADTAQFEKGLKGAEARLKGFSGASKAAATALGAAIGVIAVGALSKFIGRVQDAIVEADKMGKMAQSLGVPIESLSRLKFAAELAGVSIEELGGGITKLSRSLIDAARNGASNSAQAFRALGIDIRDSSGSVKDAETIVLEVADAFSKFTDGAGKTAVASELFGRSLGAKVIPLLNQGSAALRENFAEAEKLGVVYSQDMAKAAETFNDNLTRLDNASRGLAIQVANALLPTLNELLSAYMQLGGEVARRVPGAMDAIGTGAKEALLNVVPFANLLVKLLAIYNKFSKTPGEVIIPVFPPQDESDIARRIKAADELANRLAKQAGAAKEAAAAQRELDAIMREGQSVYDATRTPLEAYNHELENLGRLLKANAIDAETFGRAQTMAAASAVQPWLQVASTIGGALGQLFDDNKAVAIAQAIINTAQGITAALAQYPPPLSFAMAAAQAAAGAAQIATIKSTKPGSGGSVRRPNAGGGRGSSVSNDRGGTSEQAVHITLVGRSFSREEVRELITGINEAVGDGARLSVTPA